MYSALDRCVMSALLRCLGRPCHNDDRGMSTRNKSPSLSVMHTGYRECTFNPRASRRLPLWSVHPPDEKPTRMTSSSSFPTEINYLESSGTCHTLCFTNVETPGRLRFMISILIIAQCCGLLSRVLLKLGWMRCYMICSAQIQESCARFLSGKQNF